MGGPQPGGRAHSGPSHVCPRRIASSPGALEGKLPVRQPSLSTQPQALGADSHSSLQAEGQEPAAEPAPCPGSASKTFPTRQPPRPRPWRRTPNLAGWWGVIWPGLQLLHVYWGWTSPRPRLMVCWGGQSCVAYSGVICWATYPEFLLHHPPLCLHLEGLLPTSPYQDAPVCPGHSSNPTSSWQPSTRPRPVRMSVSLLGALRTTLHPQHWLSRAFRVCTLCWYRPVSNHTAQCDQ